MPFPNSPPRRPRLRLSFASEISAWPPSCKTGDRSITHPTTQLPRCCDPIPQLSQLKSARFIWGQNESSAPPPQTSQEAILFRENTARNVNMQRDWAEIGRNEIANVTYKMFPVYISLDCYCPKGGVA